MKVVMKQINTCTGNQGRQVKQEGVYSFGFVVVKYMFPDYLLVLLQLE